MSERLEELPLFPLNTVVFPYAHVQVHVFEERYREMVQHCVQYDRAFGIVLIREGDEVGGTAEPYMVGTACRIVKVQNFDDGKMDVHVQGERRFRIRRLDESRPYLVGQVEPIVEFESDETPRSMLLLEQVRGTVQRYLESYFRQLDVRATVQLPQDPTALSFVVANLLHCENRQKQHLLETTDTLERIEDMIPILEQQIGETGSATTMQRLSTEQAFEWMSPN